MALSKESIIKKKWKSVVTDRGSTIFKLIFLKELTQEEIKEKLQVQEKRKIDDQSLSNSISNYLLAWEGLNYLKKERRKNPKSKNKFRPTSNYYRANLQFFFDDAEKKKVNFTKLEKEFLEFLFSFDNIRKGLIQKDKTIIDCFERILIKIFLLDEDKEHTIIHIPLRYVALHLFKRKKGEKIITENFEDKYSKMLSGLEMNIMKLLKLKLDPLIKEDYFGGLDFGSKENEDEIYSASLEAIKEIKFN